MKKRSKKKLSSNNKYLLYESAVQDPHEQIKAFKKIYRQSYGRYPTSLCEDFCGTFLNSAEWIKHSNNNTASSIDLSVEPLNYGRKMHLAKMTNQQAARLHVIRGNVLAPLKKKYDVIAACNFSFYVFKERKILLDYCRRSFRGLNQKGAFILEMVGGAGFIDAPYEEKRTIRYKEYLLDDKLPRKKSKAVYYWSHKSYEPINRRGVYSISFKVPKKGVFKDCFTYDWRIWTIPEAKECLLEAGFKEVHVYWDVQNNPNKHSQFERRKKADSDEHTWICYVAGVK